MTQQNTMPDGVFMPDEIWATPVKTWSKFEKPATNKGDMTCNRKCAARYRYIRADLHTDLLKQARHYLDGVAHDAYDNRLVCEIIHNIDKILGEQKDAT